MDSELFLIWPISFIIEVKSASNFYVSFLISLVTFRKFCSILWLYCFKVAKLNVNSVILLSNTILFSFSEFV